MKKIHVVLILIIGMLSISSCDDEYRPTIIEGHILEYGTNKPIEWATIPINQGFTANGSVGSMPIDTVYTDDNGHFYWESKEEETSFGSGWFELGWITKEQYFGLKWTYSPYQTGIDKEEHYNETMYLDPYAYLHLHVEDVEEVDGSYCRVWTDDFRQIDDLYGEIFDEILIIKGNKMQHIYYKYNQIPNTAKVDSLYFSAHDTILHNLEY